MSKALFDQLTEPQREALRRVASLQSSKEIARDLGVSSHAIDQRVERAIRALGATDRFHAARLLAEHENGASERFPYEPPAVAQAASPGFMARPGESPAGAAQGNMLHDGADLLGSYLPPSQTREGVFERGRLINDQSTGQRLIAVGLLTIVAIVAIALLLAIMMAFGAFLHESTR